MGESIGVAAVDSTEFAHGRGWPLLPRPAPHLFESLASIQFIQFNYHLIENTLMFRYLLRCPAAIVFEDEVQYITGEVIKVNHCRYPSLFFSILLLSDYILKYFQNHTPDRQNVRTSERQNIHDFSGKVRK